jgi:hypothetical protein
MFLVSDTNTVIVQVNQPPSAIYQDPASSIRSDSVMNHEHAQGVCNLSLLVVSHRDGQEKSSFYSLPSGGQGGFGIADIDP